MTPSTVACVVAISFPISILLPSVCLDDSIAGRAGEGSSISPGINGMSPLKYQSKRGPTSSLGSAMKPSTDTTLCITTVLMCVSFVRCVRVRSVSTPDAVAEVCRRCGLDHPGRLELDVFAAEVVEHPGPAPEEHGHEVDRDLVHQPRLDELPPRVGSAHHGDVLVPGGGLRLLQRALDAVGDEGVDPALGRLRGCFVGEDEDRELRRARGAVCFPPRNRKVVGASSRDESPQGAAGPFEEFAVAVVLAERPLDQAQAAVSIGCLWPDVRPGHEPIQGHAHVEDHLSHASTSVGPTEFDHELTPFLSGTTCFPKPKRIVLVANRHASLAPSPMLSVSRSTKALAMAFWPAREGWTPSGPCSSGSAGSPKSAWVSTTISSCSRM